MAKIKFFTNTMMVISNLKTETIKKHYKFGDKLTLVDENGKPVFKIEYAENGTESLTKFGAVYNTTTSDGYAAMTIKGKESFNKEKITIQFGEAIDALNHFENMINNSTTLDEKIKKVEDAIEEVTFFEANSLENADCENTEDDICEPENLNPENTEE